jgi:hypothetical protein
MESPLGYFYNQKQPQMPEVVFASSDWSFNL